MVKKIDNSGRPGQLTGPQSVEGGKAVESAKLQGVGQVGKTEGKAPARGVRRPTRPMTAEEREHLFQLIREEADKMFGDGSLPPEKRKSVEGAVRMAIDASMVEDDEGSNE